VLAVATLPTGGRALTGLEQAASTTLEKALREKTLFVVVGAGATLASVAPEKQRSLTWPGLIDDGLNRWEQLQPHAKNKIDLYRALALDGDGLQAAQAFRRAVSSGDFSSWLKDVFASLSASDDSLYQFLKLLQALGARIITTNYDTLIETHVGMGPLDASDVAGVNAFFTDADAQVHVVFDPLDYARVGAQDASAGGAYVVQQRMRQLLTTHCVLFIGCGGTLNDPHFSALLGYANELNQNPPNRHVLLLPGIPRAGDPQYLSVQRLNQGERSQLLPSLCNLFPSVQQSVAEPQTLLSELFQANPHKLSVSFEMASDIVNMIQVSPASFPADQAVFVNHRLDHPVDRASNERAVPHKPGMDSWPRKKLQLCYSTWVLEAMDALLAHSTSWKQQDGQIQRLVVCSSPIGFEWPELSFFLLHPMGKCRSKCSITKGSWAQTDICRTLPRSGFSQTASLASLAIRATTERSHPGSRHTTSACRILKRQATGADK
jgi:hypothetical protein